MWLDFVQLRCMRVWLLWVVKRILTLMRPPFVKGKNKSFDKDVTEMIGEMDRCPTAVVDSS